MEPELNCSSHCDSSLCFIHAGVNRQEGFDILQRLCGLSRVITSVNIYKQVQVRLTNRKLPKCSYPWCKTEFNTV